MADTPGAINESLGSAEIISGVAFVTSGVELKV